MNKKIDILLEGLKIKFKQLNENSNKIDENLLNLISKETVKKYPKINKGGCAQFALAMNKLFGFNKFLLLYEDKDSIDFGVATHICIKLSDKKAYDPEGIWSLFELKRDYEKKDADLIIKDATLKDAKEYSKEIGTKYDQKELEDFIKNINNSLKENLVLHAQEELNRAGLFDKDSDYEGMIGIAVLKLIQTMAEQGHSGFSAAWVRDLFNKLSNYETLTPITSNPNEWMDINDLCGEKAGEMWQNKRNPAIFSTDGGKTWYHVDDKDTIMEGINIALNVIRQILKENKK